jgi:predicted secreted protein
VAKRLGQEYRLYVGDGASGEVFTVIAGQTGLTLDGSTELIDQSSKESGQIALQAPGRKTLTVTCSGKLDLPDANGLEQVYDLQKVYPQVPNNFQIRENPFGPGDVMFSASMFISNFSIDAPDQDNATYSFQLTLAEAPSIDLLSA